MSIAVNQIALSSEIVSKLKGTNEKPLKYLNGQAFDDCQQLPYYTNWNADAIALFSNGKTALNQNQKDSLLQNASNKQTNFLQSDLGKETPKAFADLANDSFVPVASFDDLSTFIVNAFVQFSNIRYSSFTLLKKIEGTNYYIRNTTFGNALLTDTAIKAQNENISVLNNIEEYSREIGTIDDIEKFLQYSEVSETIDSKRPTVSQSDKYSGCLSASLVSNLIEICLNGINTIRKELSCRFSEIPLDGDGSQVSVVYHSNKDISTYSDTVDIYTEYKPISDYIECFPNDLSNANIFLGWSLRSTSTSPNPAYAPGNGIYVQDKDIHLYAICKPPLSVIYDFSNFGFTNLTLNGIVDSTYPGEYTIRPFSDFSSRIKSDHTTTVAINGNRFTMDETYWGMLSADFLCWSTDPYKSPYETVNGELNTTLTSDNVKIHVRAYRRYKYLTPSTSNDFTKIASGVDVIVSGTLRLYPVFKTITVRIMPKHGRKTMRRYIDYPYKERYYWLDVGNANIGLNSQFCVADYYRLMSSIAEYEVPAAYTGNKGDFPQNQHSNGVRDPINLLGWFNDFARDANGRNTHFSDVFNGMRINSCTLIQKVLNDDGKNVRPIIGLLGLMPWWEDAYGWRYVGDAYKNNDVYFNSNNNAFFREVMQSVSACGFAFNDPWGNVINGSKNNWSGKSIQWIYMPRMSTDWVDPSCPVSFETTLHEIDITFRLLPESWVFRTSNVTTEPNYERTSPVIWIYGVRQ